MSIREDIITLAQSLGFIDIGFANGRKLSSETERYKNWIRSGYHADMYYLDKNFDKKEDISLIFESAKSVIALAYPYKTSFEHSSGDAKISKYAWGSDYHDIVKKKLKQIALYLKTTCPDSENRVYVDTGPTLDRQWAIEAGLGWQGKNGNIINPKYGSMFFIGLIITSISFTSNETIKNMCGKCTACIESCPTNAIVAPKVVDSNKCIAYWTIEAKPDIPIPDDIANSLNGWAYGCDICQDVCPWNKRLTFNTEDELLKPRFGETNFDIETIYSMTDEDFRNRYSKSPIKRTKLEGIKRNIAALNRVGGA